MPCPVDRVFLPRRTFLSVACLVALTVAVTGGLDAASTSFWLVSTQAEFLKGDAERLSIDSDGRVTLGPAVELVHDVASPAVWRLLAGDRDTLWAATGNDGKVWTVDGSGKATVLFDAAELDVHALAPAPSGGVFAASSPDGKVYRVSADGSATTFFDPDDTYIWTLAASPDGSLFVGTGEKGRIYKVDADGRGSVFFESETAHVMTLVADGRGGLLVGTSSPGRVLRIDAAGKAFVLLESSHKEIHGLRVGPTGVIYATAAGAAGTTGAPDPPPAKSPAETTAGTIPTVTTEITVSAIGDSTIVTPATSGLTSENRPTGPQKGAVYRINPDGEWSVVWESPEDLPYDVIVEPSGSLLVATGSKGKILSAVRRSDAGHTRHAPGRPASDGIRRGSIGSSPGRDVESWSHSSCHRGHLRQGHLSLRREGHVHGGDVGRPPLEGGDAGRHQDRAVDAKREHADP